MSRRCWNGRSCSADLDGALDRLLNKADADNDANGPDHPVAQMDAARAGKRKRKTRLWILSDLHLEAVPHPEAFRPIRPAFDVLVVAGDVWEGDSRRALETVAGLVSQHRAASGGLT